MSDQQLKELEQNIRRSQVAIEHGKALTRLLGNKDFQVLILTGYLEKEAIRLVQLKASNEMQGEAQQALITKKIDAIGAFGQFMQSIRNAAAAAEKTLMADEATREEILAEEDIA